MASWWKKKVKPELPGVVLKDGKRYMEIAGEMRPVCGAKTRSGKPCKNPPMTNGRCRMHGGKSLAGVTSPNFKHGRHSKYAPKNLRERYEQAISDPELLRLDDEIALTDVRISEILETLDLGDSKAAWARAQDLYATFLDAQRKQDAPTAAMAMRQLGEIINQGLDTIFKWNELFNAFESRRKLVEAERRRRMDMQLMVSADEMNVLLNMVLSIIKEYIPKDRLPDVTEEFRKLVTKN